MSKPKPPGRPVITQYFLPPCSNCSSGRSPLKCISTTSADSPRLLAHELMIGRKRPEGCRFCPVNVAVVVYQAPGGASSASSFCERAAPPKILASVAGAYADSSTSAVVCAEACRVIRDARHHAPIHVALKPGLHRK